MKTTTLLLTPLRYEFLQAQYHSGKLTAFNRGRLRAELRDAKIVSYQTLPLNIVDENCDVLLTNVQRHQTFSIHIAGRDEGRIPSRNIVSVSNPIAVALFGYPPGAITEWEMADGINRFKIISVTKCPEKTPILRERTQWRNC